jgi:hypothetical protein
MFLFRPLRRSRNAGRIRVAALVAILGALAAGTVLAVPALGHQAAGAHNTQGAYPSAAAAVAAASSSSSGLANLPDKKA